MILNYHPKMNMLSQMMSLRHASIYLYIVIFLNSFITLNAKGMCVHTNIHNGYFKSTPLLETGIPSINK